MLSVSREFSVDILKDFECGVEILDEFIHGSLGNFLEKKSNYSFYVARDENLGIVAMFVTSHGIFVDRNSEFDHLPFGKPWAYLDDDLQINSGTAFPTIEIDYLAVRKDLRTMGFGSEIIMTIADMAKQKGCYFLTVEAYHQKTYSAVPFYQKQGFFPLQQSSDEYDTLRMARRV